MANSSASNPPVRAGAEVGSSPAARGVFAAGCMVAGAALAMGAAAIWARLADPPAATLTRQGSFLGEQQLDQQVGVTLWFLVISVAFGVVSGLVVGVVGRRHGVTTVVAALLLAVVGAALSAWLGTSVFGPDEAAQLSDAGVGDLITSKLTITTDLAYLGWPIGSLAGVITGIAAWPSRPKPLMDLPASSTVIGQQ